MFTLGIITITNDLSQRKKGQWEIGNRQKFFIRVIRGGIFATMDVFRY